MYAVLFASDHQGVSLDANDDMAALLDREQTIEARETLDEIMAALGGSEEREKIVVRNMDASTSESIVENLTDLGIKREVIRVKQ